MNRVQATRLLSDWLDGASGINAKLAIIPRDGTDAQPANLTVYDETRNTDTALGRLPIDGLRPCAQVAVLGETIGDLPQMVVPTRDYRVTFGIRLALTNDQSHEGSRDLGYYEKATVESLLALHQSSDASRTRGALYLEAPIDEAWRVSAVQAIENDETVTSLITVRYQVRDTA